MPWDERTMPESIREWRHNMWVTTKGLVVAVRRGESVEVSERHAVVMGRMSWQHLTAPTAHGFPPQHACTHALRAGMPGAQHSRRSSGCSRTPAVT